jgi:hypothetical protein
MLEEVPMKEKKRIAAGINWRRMITAPMIMKIQRAIPASLRLIDLANAGVAIRVIKPTINPANQGFLPFNILHPPFLMGSTLIYCISCANVKLKNRFDLFI